MATQTIDYVSYSRICCGTLPAEVIICVPSPIVEPVLCPNTETPESISRSYIEGTITEERCFKHECKVTYTYTLEIDDSQLVEDHMFLASEVLGLFCKDCRASWVEDLVGDEIQVTVEGQNITITSQHGCETEFSLISGDLSVLDTNSINLTLAADVLSGEVNLSSSSNNQISSTGTGIYVPPITVVDSSSVDFTLTPAVGSQSLTGAVKLSADAFNALSIEADGLYAELVAQTWLDWVPTYTPSGAMTFGPVTTSIAKYIQIGKLVIFQLVAGGVIGGTPDSNINFTLPPIAPVDSDAVSCTALVSNVTRRGGIAQIIQATSSVDVRLYDSSNFTAGAASLRVSGMYESA